MAERPLGLHFYFTTNRKRISGEFPYRSGAGSVERVTPRAFFSRHSLIVMLISAPVRKVMALIHIQVSRTMTDPRPP